MAKIDVLTRNVEDVIIRSDLERKLASGKKLRIKHGVDPTNPQYHIGRAVVLWKMRELQEMGHTIVLIIGDFTATIGDSSDKTSERQPLTRKQVDENKKEYLAQIGRVLDIKKVEVHHNSEWFDKMPLSEFFVLAEQFTISQMIERENFALRLAANKPVGLHETLYPILQGYDSVAIKADVEIGGTDQLFNMLAGRAMQKYFSMPQQNVITTQLLVGTDGRKMSSSWGNCIYITDEPLDMYGKIMSTRDELIPAYLRMTTDMPLDQIEQIERDMSSGANPRDSKAALARRVVARYYDESKAAAAEEDWKSQFQRHEAPKNITEVAIAAHKKPHLLDILTEQFGLTKSEVRRMLEQNGVRVNGEVVTSAAHTDFADGALVQVGKRRAIKIIRA